MSRAGHLLLDHSHCLCEWRGSQPKRTIILQWDVRQCPNELAKGTRLDGVICYQEARCSDRTTSIFHTCHCLGLFSFSLHDNQIIAVRIEQGGSSTDSSTSWPGTVSGAPGHGAEVSKEPKLAAEQELSVEKQKAFSVHFVRKGCVKLYDFLALASFFSGVTTEVYAFEE